MGKTLFEKEKSVKDTAKQKFNLESEIRHAVETHEQESEINFNNKMILDKNDQFSKMNNERHIRDQKLIGDY